MKMTLAAALVILSFSACRPATDTPDVESDEAAIRDLIRRTDGASRD